MEDGTGTAYADGAEVRNLATEGEVTLYAQWSTNTFTVSFDTGRGSHVASQTVDYDKVVTKPDDPTLAGFAFDGWYADEGRTQAFDFTTEITADQTLYAKWSPNAYAAKFDANGGEGTVADQQFTYGAKQALTENSFTRTGYTFIEWNTELDGSGRSYADAAEVSNLTADPDGAVTLHAQWDPNTYLVGFDANAEDATGEMDSQPFKYDEEQALLGNSFTREGYRFAGWNAEPDGSGTMYADREAVKNLTAEASGYVGLWAQWEKADDSAVRPADESVKPAANAGPGFTEAEMDAFITKIKSDADPAGTTYAPIKLKMKNASKKSFTVGWSKVGNAKKLVVYAAKGGKNYYKKLKTLPASKKKLKVTKVAGKKLKAKTTYKLLVVAFDSNGKSIAASKVVHIMTAGGKKGNAKSVKVRATKKVKKGKKLKLKKGKSAKIKAAVVMKPKKSKKLGRRALRFESSNPKVVVVNAKSGKAKALTKGKAKIYVYAEDGVSATVSVKVK